MNSILLTSPLVVANFFLVLHKYFQSSHIKIHIAHKKNINKCFTNICVTGNTPIRREFSYPRVLAATSPHERILTKFRELNGGLPRLDIPEVSLNTVDSYLSVSGLSNLWINHGSFRRTLQLFIIASCNDSSVVRYISFGYMYQ
jgi:hypothetical protein